MIATYTIRGLELKHETVATYDLYWLIKGMEHVPNIFISFDKYLFLEVINILI